ncbi:RND transporter [Thermus thermophilus]|uniref:efflux RND transporter periplasmic adaptor subunit n=1 Tax=Thermus thermophilus TaxID=274 RepID=UPI001FCAA57E|nr:efflux RND transporter periplasmic adaptor subunit [Thermus thermophilus]BDG26382.1 RND transporter [Thermus thermophilus]
MRARRLLWIPLLAVLVALGFFLLRPKPEENQATAFQVVEATRGDLRVTVSGYGWLSPWETLEVRPEITGTLVWLAEEGQEVQEGEVVARLDPTPFARALAEAEAEVRRQEANLENARLQGQSALASLTASVKSAEIAYANAKQDLETARQNLEATRLVYEAGGASRQDLLAAEAAYAAAERALENAGAALAAQRKALNLREAQLAKELEALQEALRQAQLTLASARENLEAVEVKAPFSGVVLSQEASLGAQVSPETALLTLGDLSAFRLVLQVDETEIGKIQVGQKVAVTLDGLPGETLEGEVVAKSPEAELVNNIPVFEVTVRLPADPRLRPGMSADGEIVVQEAKDVILLPKGAVRRGPRGASVTVLRPDGSTETVPVRLGLEDSTRVAVLEGLQEGDQVVLPQGTGGSRGTGSPGSARPGPTTPIPFGPPPGR